MMKKLVMAGLCSIFIAIPAEAAVDFTKVEMNIGANSALGIQGTSSGNIDTWNTTGLGVAGIYDLSSKLHLGENTQPYAGIGLVYISKRWSGVGPEKQYTGKKSGLYVTGGVTYVLTPRFSVDFNYNSFGTLTLGLSHNL
jgi:opacity protein-like surface antigen